MLKLGAGGALALFVGGTVPLAARRLSSYLSPAEASTARPLTANAVAPNAIVPAASTVDLRLAATDGFIKLPGRGPLYMFGFVDVPFSDTIDSLDIFRGNVQNPAPLIAVPEDADVTLRLTNIGLAVRPDLDDSHTIHWHGFRSQITIFDGVPEPSISVPPARDFSYFYRPHEEGTYMYHCHFEDTEHVQMGMIGVIYVEPKQNLGDGPIPPGKYAYNDGVLPSDPRSTFYDREFAMLLDDIDPRPHDLLESVQEFVWSDYSASYWLINGRAYPDTILPNKGEPGADPALEFQPISSLVQVEADDVVLLRVVNLGFEQHAMELPGITMKVVGEDASSLGLGGTGSPSYDQSGRADISYFTNILYIGPGEARDVRFTAPAHSGGVGPDVYQFRNRNSNKLVNGSAPGLGGMLTEVRVYPSGTLPPQAAPNETYPV
ncbi:MAG: multicopper oxidase domain-containing protein [Dehalococcoidia bacterium]